MASLDPYSFLCGGGVTVGAAFLVACEFCCGCMMNGYSVCEIGDFGFTSRVITNHSEICYFTSF
ncbi:hypothetical protein GHT06_013875 [Daphnia sinensis]|uniref:Uncharacterized protein n=1 Tax=Daphnia sinensis TaxID=1820382 RepID=A0AAD5LCT0_9CRUS|nr:hypothetical protein GHT06_013875 [Daphnia sinensis]